MERGWAEDGCGQDLLAVQALLINRRTNRNVPFLFFHLPQFLGMRKEASKKCWHFSEKQRQLKGKVSYFVIIIFLGNVAADIVPGCCTKHPVWVCSVFKYRSKAVDSPCP